MSQNNTPPAVESQPTKGHASYIPVEELTRNMKIGIVIGAVAIAGIIFWQFRSE